MLLVFLFYLFYLLFLLWMVSGLKQGSAKRTGKTYNSPSSQVSVVIPFRNESKHLPSLLSDLENQKVDKKYFEIIFVNDHSQDDGIEILESLLKNSSVNASVISLGPEERGKKAAIFRGNSVAKFDFHIQIDADVELGDRWLHQILSELDSQASDMLILPVFKRSGDGFVEQFDALDYAALQGLGMAMAENDFPILCSGANLCYSKDLYFSSEVWESEISSGDDVFLLEFAVSNNARITPLLSPEVKAATHTVNSVGQLLNQRARWAGKNKQVKDWIYWLIYIYLSLGNLLLFYVFLVAPKIALTCFILKSAGDILLVREYLKSIEERLIWLTYVWAPFVYPFYIFSLLLVMVSSKRSWKGRPVVD